MATNLLENAKTAVGNINIRHQNAWSDSSVALHWIKGNGNYKQFVKNRVTKIRTNTSINWRHIPGEINPADIASRGSHKLGDMWWKGPDWLSDVNRWPKDIMTEPTEESENESKFLKEIFAVAFPRDDPFQGILAKHRF